ncbi:MAG: hypothetical protein AB1744_07925, partial [Candidatus Zixiibacteriota bacterium]
AVSTSWPSLTIRISRFTRLPLIQGIVNKFIDVFSPRTSYTRQTKESFDLDGGFLTHRTMSINHNPLVSVNLKIWRSLSLSSGYTLAKSNDERYNPADGSFQSETRTTRSTLSLTSQYSFSAPSGIRIPLFGKIRFRSSMQIEVKVNKSNDKSETRRGEADWVTSSDKAEFSVTPNISYNFSQQIKGGVRADWRDSADNMRNRKSHSRMLELWVEIRF